MRRISGLVAVGLLGLLLAQPVLGHDSPEHVIDDLTALMKRRQPTAPLLYRRACEYRLLSRWKEATADLRDALARDPRYFPAALELGRVQLEQGQIEPALKASQRAEALATSDRERARVHLLRCHIQLAREAPEEALVSCQTACQLQPGEIEWSLQLSQLQSELGQHSARLASLEAACRENPAAILQIELLEARIDAGAAAETLDKIEQELADSRWKSSWLIRRARARRQLGDEPAARADLQAAITEISTRLKRVHPDPLLLLDRALAHALLRNRKAALADVDSARERYVDSWEIKRVERLLSQRSMPAAASE